MKTPFYHQPVLAKEVTSIFSKKTGQILVDATAGGGGHLAILAEIVGEQGKVFAFDRDPRALKDDAASHVYKKFSDRITLIHGAFSDIKTILSEQGIHHIDGALAGHLRIVLA